MGPEERAAVQLALGRIFRLASRPAQEGDAQDYERCRAIILEVLNPDPYRPPICWARDRLKGAQGD